MASRCPPASARAGPELDTSQGVGSPSHHCLGRGAVPGARQNSQLSGPDTLATQTGPYCAPAACGVEPQRCPPWGCTLNTSFLSKCLLSTCCPAALHGAGVRAPVSRLRPGGHRASRGLCPSLSTLPRGSGGCTHIRAGTSEAGGSGRALTFQMGLAPVQGWSGVRGEFKHTWGVGLGYGGESSVIHFSGSGHGSQPLTGHTHSYNKKTRETSCPSW